MSQQGLACLTGQWRDRVNPPASPDVIVGKWRGWSAHRVRDGRVRARKQAPEVFLPVMVVAQVLNVTRTRVTQLRKRAAESGFPLPAVCIGPYPPVTTASGLDGCVYGWDEQTILSFRDTSGRTSDEHKAGRGRPAGSGNYRDLPRCGRPRTESVHGHGTPCKGVRRKVAGRWAPACGVHLTSRERRQWGLGPA